ncbi:MAG TPA: hypothetical protein VJ875_11395 [Pyrinomonadaceae bacterium]|nr:hypothetical protein [Pyrinomonadaceae bacterium]
MNNRYIYLSLTLVMAVVCFPGADAQKPLRKVMPPVARPSSGSTEVTRKTARARGTRVSSADLQTDESSPETTANAALALSASERRIVSLIERSPFVDPKPENALGGEDFMLAAAQFGIPMNEKGSPLDTLRALEAKISRVGPVHANVSSTPDNLSVRYYRLGDGNLKFDTTTNNPRVPLDPPATYVFECTGPGGVTKKQQVACAIGCTVTFNF